MTHRPGSPSGTIRRPARSTMASSRIATVSVTVASFQRCGAGAFSGRNVRTESPALHDGRDPLSMAELLLLQTQAVSGCQQGD